MRLRENGERADELKAANIHPELTKNIQSAESQKLTSLEYSALRHCSWQHRES